MNLNRPNLQGLVSPTGASKANSMGGGDGADPLEAHRRAASAQDKFNLDVQQILAAPIVWNALNTTGAWVWYGGTNTTPAWAWDPFHWRVWLKGAVKGGVASTTTPLFSNAPPVPAHLADFGVLTDTGAGELIVRANGSICLASGGGGFVLMDGLSYDPAA